MRDPAEAQSYDVDGRQTRAPKLPSQSWRHDHSALIKDSINFNVRYLGSIFIKKLQGRQLAEAACLKLRVSWEWLVDVDSLLLPHLELHPQIPVIFISPPLLPPPPLLLQTSVQHTKKVPQIVLSVSWKGVKFIDSQSKVCIIEAPFHYSFQSYHQFIFYFFHFITFPHPSSQKVVSYHAIRQISYCTTDIEDKSVFAYITKDRSACKNYSHVFVAPSQVGQDWVCR